MNGVVSECYIVTCEVFLLNLVNYLMSLIQFIFNKAKNSEN